MYLNRTVGVRDPPADGYGRSFLIVTGTAELFTAECDSLCYNLRKAGLPVEELNVEDEVQ